MSRTKLVIAVCFAAFALSALAAATASAGSWDVGGKTLATGSKAAIASPIKVLEHGELVAAGVKIVCSATELGISGGELVGPDEIRAKDLTFKNCTASEPCSLANETVLTLALHGLVELDGTLAAAVKLLPLPSKTFAALHFEGEKCALLGVQPVTGTADLLAPAGKDPSVLQLVNGFSLPGSLKVGSSEGTLTGLRTDIQLESKETWNFL
jgi:hypothetical protein